MQFCYTNLSTEEANIFYIQTQNLFNVQQPSLIKGDYVLKIKVYKLCTIYADMF